MANNAANQGPLRPGNKTKSRWETVGMIMWWSILSAVVAVLSCLVGVKLHERINPVGAWLTLMATLGLADAPGRMAFATGIAIGLTARSFYRRIIRLSLLTSVFGVFAFAFCFLGLTEENWRTGIWRYAVAGALAGAILALYQLRQRRSEG